MMHPDTELRFVSPELGFGVYAARDIPKGTLTYVQDRLDISIDESAYGRLDPERKKSVDRYAFIDQYGNRVLCWDHAKYVNHCCYPNTISTGYGFEIAIRDIRAGEQITDDYGLFNLPDKMDFFCDLPDCRKNISQDDIARYQPQWDERIIDSLRFADKVPQDLLPYLDDAVREKLFAYLAGKLPYVSVLAAQYHRN